MSIIDEYLRRVSERISPEQQTKLCGRQPYRRATKPPIELASWGLKTTKLRQGLWDNRIATMTQLTSGRRRGPAKLKHAYDSAVNPRASAARCTEWVNILIEVGMLNTAKQWLGNENNVLSEEGVRIRMNVPAKWSYIEQELQNEIAGNESTCYALTNADAGRTICRDARDR